LSHWRWLLAHNDVPLFWQLWLWLRLLHHGCAVVLCTPVSKMCTYLSELHRMYKHLAWSLSLSNSEYCARNLVVC
jgi:hypothetical protein